MRSHGGAANDMTWIFAPLAPLSFEVIVVDAPWSFTTWSEAGKGKSADRHYATMALDEIKALPICDLAQKDCLLLMWATAPMLPEALACMAAWSFTYKSNIVWRKTTLAGKVRMGPGYWARTMHEQVLIGSLGKPRKFSAFPSCFDGIAREHSRKPIEFYHLVDKHTIGLRRADLFARETHEGYQPWGLESTKFNAEAA